MLKAQVEVGKVYVMKVSGGLTRVRLDSVSPYGGWNGTNLKTGREVRIRTAAKLRYESAIAKSTLGLALEVASGLNNQTHGD